MQILEVSDIKFTTNRHTGGGNLAISFGDSAFLYGRGGPTVIRQKGSKARLALATVWAKLQPVMDEEGDLIEDYDLQIEIKEVRSIRLQANLHALKRRGYIPFKEFKAAEYIHLKDESARSSYRDMYDVLQFAREDCLHVDNVWVARPGCAVVRDGWSAIATAVVMFGGANHHDVDSLIDGYEPLVARLGIIL